MPAKSVYEIVQMGEFREDGSCDFSVQELPGGEPVFHSASLHRHADALKKAGLEVSFRRDEEIGSAAGSEFLQELIYDGFAYGDDDEDEDEDDSVRGW